jgi:hypothetical protein
MCTTSLQRKRSKIISITGKGAWTKQWWTTLVHCVKHEKIFEQIYKLMTAAVHGDGTLVVVCDTALGTTLQGIGTGVIGWDFSWFLHFVVTVSSQCVMDVMTVIDMLAQYRQCVHII